MSDNLSNNISIKIITSASIDDLAMLYKSAGWWESSYDLESRFLNHIVKNSSIFVGAFFKEKMIGMGRALSDMASDAYIQDVTVLDEFKRKGIGKKIVRLLIDELKANGVDWIGLIAEPGTSHFYEGLGFEQLNNHVPLKYKD
jgi:spermidine synthase